jgi:hypothetical protein
MRLTNPTYHFAAEIAEVGGGIDLMRTRRKNWYRKTVLESEKV